MAPARGDYRASVSYTQAHLRIKKDRGLPIQHMCIECGDQAREWAYMGGDPDELVNERGTRYSLDQGRYSPMCFPCHRRHDHALADGRTVDVCPRGHSWAEHGSMRRKRTNGAGLRFCRACHRENSRDRRARSAA